MTRVRGDHLIVLRRREAQEGHVRCQYRHGRVYEGWSMLLGPWLLFSGYEVYSYPEEAAGD